MDKQKQIEELRDLLYGFWNSDIVIGDKYKIIAEALYNAGYRKIPENAVVLTDKKDIQQFEWSKMLDKMGVFKFANNLRKDTTNKIYAELLKEENLEPFLFTYNGNIRDGKMIREEKIKEIAKQNGVEVE